MRGDLNPILLHGMNRSDLFSEYSASASRVMIPGLEYSYIQLDDPVPLLFFIRYYGRYVIPQKGDFINELGNL